MAHGGLAQCRIGSKHLALQIKAIEEGLLPRAVGAAAISAEPRSKLQLNVRSPDDRFNLDTFFLLWTTKGNFSPR